MYILLAVIAACALGVTLHFAMPRRELRGAAVTPAIATATTAAVYTVMQWAGVPEGDALLWVASIGAGIGLAAAATAALTAQRVRSDAAEKRSLGI